MNLGDPELELIDPTPNIYRLFSLFDDMFFWSKLKGRAVVRWSKRMYSCAGVCSYEGKGGLCDIALSEPLLKLRPRKNLVETLLHEMIHAYLFITNQDRDRDGHGPNFQSHMHRINHMAGIHITIYHDFHEEVELYLTHWWRCDGPCQRRDPYFGVVRRTCNKPPGPSDYWWNRHQQICGGTFVKIKEPEKQGKKTTSNPTLKPSYRDIRNYLNNKNTQTDVSFSTSTSNKQPQPILNNNNKSETGKNVNQTPNSQPKEVLKDASNTLPNNNFGNKAYILKAKIFIKDNLNNAPVQNGNTFSQPVKINFPIFDHNGNVSDGRQRTQSANVVNTVRIVWGNKQIPNVSNAPIDGIDENNPTNSRKTIDTANPNKHKNQKPLDDSPPHKVKKINDTNEELAKSVLKDVYGKDFNVSRSVTDNKYLATIANMVVCPICEVKVSDDKINAHLDECLNKDVIKKLTKDYKSENNNTNLTDTPLAIPGGSLDKSKNIKDPLIKSKAITDFNGNQTKQFVNIRGEKVDNFIDLSGVGDIEKERNSTANLIPPKCISIDYDMPSTSKENTFGTKDVANVKTVAKKINYDKQKSGHVEPEKDGDKEREVDLGYLPSFLDEPTCKIKLPAVKIQPEDDLANINYQKCPCCGHDLDKPIEQHFDECLAFFENRATIPEEGTSKSDVYETITLDDSDDVFDESLELNETGTKNPCPCCLKMVENVDMNDHLDTCLFS